MATIKTTPVKTETIRNWPATIQRVVASGPSDEAGLVLLDDRVLKRFVKNPEYWARHLALDVFTDWAGRRCVRPADARLMIQAQKDHADARAAEDAEYEAYRQAKAAAAAEKLAKEREESHKRRDEAMVRARIEAEQRRVENEAQMRREAEEKKARENQPVSREEYKAGKR